MFGKSDRKQSWTKKKKEKKSKRKSLLRDYEVRKGRLERREIDGDNLSKDFGPRADAAASARSNNRKNCARRPAGRDPIISDTSKRFRRRERDIQTLLRPGMYHR